MCSICLIDTSIFLNILNVPNRNQHRIQVLEDYKTFIEVQCNLILPMATVIETGNQIAQNGDGTTRRKTAQYFVEQVRCALIGEAPWKITKFFTNEEILEWLDKFPDLAGKNKKTDKLEGTSFGDLSIIEEFHKSCKLFSMSEVFIWSLDKDLHNYHQKKQ